MNDILYLHIYLLYSIDFQPHFCMTYYNYVLLPNLIMRTWVYDMYVNAILYLVFCPLYISWRETEYDDVQNAIQLQTITSDFRILLWKRREEKRRDSNGCANIRWMVNPRLLHPFTLLLLLHLLLHWLTRCRNSKRISVLLLSMTKQQKDLTQQQRRRKSAINTIETLQST